MRLCSNGKWTGEDLQCKAAGCSPLVRDSSAVVTACSEEEGGQCNFACPAGSLHHSGSLSLTCSNGEWIGIPPVCIPNVCEDLLPPSFAEGVPCRGREEGTVCQFVCSHGYQATHGQSLRLCSAGHWSGSDLVCEPKSCGSLPLPAHAIERCEHSNGYTVNGGVCRHVCNAGYVPTAGNSTRVCYDGVLLLPGVACWLVFVG